MSGEEEAERLETVAAPATEFEANTLVALLDSAGIEAFAFGAAHGGIGIPLGPGTGIPVQVRRVDVEAARRVLEERRPDSESPDLDAGPLADGPSRSRMPFFATAAFVVTVLIALLAILSMVVMLVL